MIMTGLLDRVCEHEGFESKPYQDHLGNWTFGHGLTWISEEESKAIVDERLAKNATALIGEHPWIKDHSREIFEVLVEMSYQMGVAGCLGFKKMWLALEERDYVGAATEGMDSKWAKQTPNRARGLMQVFLDS